MKTEISMLILNDLMRKILGYCLEHPEKTVEVEDYLFSDDKERRLFCSLKERFLSKRAVNVQALQIDAGEDFTLSELLVYQNEGFGVSYAYFCELRDIAVTEFRLIEIEHEMNMGYQEIQKETTTLGRLTKYSELQERLLKISTSASKNQVEKNPTLGDAWLENYEKPVIYKAKTGFPALDHTIGGLHGTEFVIVIADTGVGKTNLLLNMAHNMLKQKKSILFFSLEMGTNELLDRMMPIIGGHNAFQVRERSVRKEMLHETLVKFKGYDLKIISSGNITSSDVIAEIVNQKNRGPVDIVMVDYLQRLSDDKGRDSEMERLRTMVRRLKNGALNIGVPIITPVQVDKASSKSGIIRVENVAGAKDIANEADLGLYLYEKELKGESVLSKERKTELRLRVVKSRHSAKGLDVKMLLDPETLQMREVLDSEGITATEMRQILTPTRK